MFENREILKDLSNSLVPIYDHQIEDDVLNETIDEACSTTTISQGMKEGI